MLKLIPTLIDEQVRFVFRYNNDTVVLNGELRIADMYNPDEMLLDTELERLFHQLVKVLETNKS